MPNQTPRPWRRWAKWSTLAIAAVIALIWFGSDNPIITLSLRFPLWALALPFAAAAAWLWWLDRKPDSAQCPRCGHDLAGIPGPCPECGSV